MDEKLVAENGWNTFFEASHADFLQAGGARLVPVDYRQDDESLRELLSSLNGLYIPGDTMDSFDDYKFISSVKNALDWVQEHNMQEGKHFPVIGNSYGMLSMLKSQLPVGSSRFKALDVTQVHESLAQNLLQHPAETFLFDEIEGLKLEELLDNINFYNEVTVGITKGDFDYIRELNVFIPVTSFHAEGDGKDEFVSTIEGTVQPFFGFLNRLDKI